MMDRAAVILACGVPDRTRDFEHKKPLVRLLGQGFSLQQALYADLLGTVSYPSTLMMCGVGRHTAAAGRLRPVPLHSRTVQEPHIPGA